MYRISCTHLDQLCPHGLQDVWVSLCVYVCDTYGIAIEGKLHNRFWMTMPPADLIACKGNQTGMHHMFPFLANSQCAEANASMCVVVSSAACMTQKWGGCHLWETRMLLKAVCAWDDIHISV